MQSAAAFAPRLPQGAEQVERWPSVYRDDLYKALALYKPPKKPLNKQLDYSRGKGSLKAVTSRTATSRTASPKAAGQRASSSRIAKVAEKASSKTAKLGRRKAASPAARRSPLAEQNVGRNDDSDGNSDESDDHDERDLTHVIITPETIQRCFCYSDVKGQKHLLLSTQKTWDCPFDIASNEWRRTKRPGKWPEYLQWPADVMRCRSWDGPCLVCGMSSGETPCGCSVPKWRGQHSWPTVRKLYMFPEKGIGVITQRTWQSGDYLGDYVGEIRPYNDHENNSYCLAVSINASSSRRIAMIDAKTYGNWTRFVNHSCRANLTFKEANVGGYRIYALVALRDIEVGEELTIDYGPGFIGEGAEASSCHCSEPSCRYRGRKSRH